MTGDKQARPGTAARQVLADTDIGLLEAAFEGNADKARVQLMAGADVNAQQHTTGLSALHVAAGNSDLELARLLIEHGAAFGPDAFGRWPSLIAAECSASDEMCEFIADAEARFLALSSA